MATIKPRFIDGIYQVGEAEALKKLIKIAIKINEFNNLPIRQNNIEKISEILNMVNDHMLDIIVYDCDSIYYGLMFNVVSVINHYKDNKNVYDNQSEEVVTKFEKLLITSTGMITLYLKNHYNKFDNKIILESSLKF
jgi:hypothetical protein